MGVEKISPSKDSCEFDECISFNEKRENEKEIVRGRTHFVKFFLDTGYYLCVLPFKIVDTEGDGWYKKQGFLPHQAMCAVMHFIAIWQTVTTFRYFDIKDVGANPRIYFQLFTTALHLSVIVSFIYVSWKKADVFCKLVHMVQNCPIISLWYPRWINLILSIIAILFMAISLLSPVFGTKGVNQTWENWHKCHVQNGRHSLFFNEIKYNTPGVNTTEDVSKKQKISLFQFPDFLFFMWSAVIEATEWVFVAHCSLIMLVMSLTLYCATNHFINNLKNYPSCKLTLVNYEALKGLSGIINDIVGLITLTYTMDCIMYYATNLHSILSTGAWFSLVTMIIFFLASVAWLHFASYSCLLMDRFRDWIRQKENRTSLPPKSVTVILLIDEISTNVVGMSGHGLFTINYKFVAQALTSLMTYFIIVIQFK